MCPIWLPCLNPSNFILHTERMHTCMGFLSQRTSEFNFFPLFFLFSMRSRVVQVHGGVCVLDLKMHVKFPSNLLELNFLQHALCDPTFCSNALKSICIVTDCQPLSASSSLLPSLHRFLSPLFPLNSSLTLSSCISVSLSLALPLSICLPSVYWGFFNSSIQSLLSFFSFSFFSFCL